MTLKEIKTLLAQSSKEPAFGPEGAVPTFNLEVGKVYVTKGGAALVEEDDELRVKGWGFEHARLIEISKHFYILETEWNPNLQVSDNYPLFKTSDQTVKSLFPLLGPYINKMELTFDDAKESGLLLSANTATSTGQSKTTQSIKKDEIDAVTRRGIIKYFKAPRKMSDAAVNFDMPYRQMRNIIVGIEERGFEGKRYKLHRSEDSAGKLMIHLTEK